MTLEKKYVPYHPAPADITAVLPGAKLLSLKVSNTQELETKLSTGLPSSLVAKIASICHINQDAMSAILGMGKSTLNSYTRTDKRLPAEQSAKIYRLARVIERTQEVVGTDAKEWLHSPVLALGNRTPLEALKSDIGAERVLQLLERLDDGVYS